MKQDVSPKTLDVAKLRRETAGCEDIIHFNAAGAALPPEPVYQALVGHLELERKIGGYEAERAAVNQLNSFYDEFAALLNCDTSEIAHVENATRAWDMAFNGLGLQEGDRVITHSSEYASNY